MTNAEQTVVASWRGHCPICEQDTVFEARNAWFRDHLICRSCPGGSIPRERAIMQVMRELAPDWKGRSVHEGSPMSRGASVILARDCVDYTPTQFYPDVPRGAYRDGARCEDLEQQTFDDESFDLVITQDVMEHIFHPDRAYREIWRTLKPGGLYLHTTPIYKDRVTTERRASLAKDGKVVHLAEPEYHGNPVDRKGSLVTFHYGYDLADLIAEWTPFDVEIRRFHQRSGGIVAEFSEVVICRKV
jgi:SAM-dependent methyltransferase